TLVFAINNHEVADHHYAFYGAIAWLAAENEESEAQTRSHRLLREELGAEVHGEADERSWHLKHALLRRHTNLRREAKPFRDYARQSYEDTLTLYLHGICC